MSRRLFAISLSNALFFGCGSKAPTECRIAGALSAWSIETMEARRYDGAALPCRALFLEQSGNASMRLVPTWNESLIRVDGIVLGGAFALKGNEALLRLPLDPPPESARVLLSGLPHLDGSEWPRIIELEITANPTN